MSSRETKNRVILISIQSELKQLKTQINTLRQDIHYIRGFIEDTKPIVINKDGEEEEPIKSVSWFWGS
tara:strand:+ start:9144 stop:9347 length:204 start_codon:yes stop_codon:yes gene_type:complete